MVSLPGRKEQRTIAVFGSSEPGPADPVYEEARQIGLLLARAGCVVLNGGYGGVMEASSRGAREADGHVIGVTVESFSRPCANSYLVEEVREPDLYCRSRRLIEGGDAFIILPGRSGTLSELTLLWALLRARQIPDKRISLMGKGWPVLLKTLRQLNFLEPRLLEVTRCTPNPDQAVAWALSEIPDSR